VAGKVTGSRGEAVLEEDDSFAVYTVYTFEVANLIKGKDSIRYSHANTIEVIRIGGETDEYVYESMPNVFLEENGEYLLFLNTITDDMDFRSFNTFAGKYSLDISGAYKYNPDTNIGDMVLVNMSGFNSLRFSYNMLMNAIEEIETTRPSDLTFEEIEKIRDVAHTEFAKALYGDLYSEDSFVSGAYIPETDKILVMFFAPYPEIPNCNDDKKAAFEKEMSEIMQSVITVNPRLYESGVTPDWFEFVINYMDSPDCDGNCGQV
jgi:hypothetical protein